MGRTPRLWGAAALLAGLLSLRPGDGVAQVMGTPPAPQSGPDGLTDARQKLEGVQGALTQSAEQRRRTEADLETARADRLRLNQALIETTGRVQEAETRIGAITAKLDTLTGSQEAIQQSLESRRGTIMEILASLQRMGRKPPPAILVRPEDILKTIRTSMLLGAVLPEMRSEAETLAADLEELTRLRTAISTERDALKQQIADLGAERTRLGGLIEARQQAQSTAEAELDAERSRAADLAGQATTLRDLIGRLEGQEASARKAADAAEHAAEAQRKLAEADADAIRAKVAAGPFRDPARLEPAVPFADTKGLLPLPVSGRLVKSFGQSDGFGGSEKGLSFATAARAVVSAPGDGWVVFSGPYRTYGQVLILNMGAGYYTVLAGLDHADVAAGQFVLSGEPVGSMGDGSVKAAAAIALGAADPVLYVELRKDGAAIDPSPWWAKAAFEKVRG